MELFDFLFINFTRLLGNKLFRSDVVDSSKIFFNDKNDTCVMSAPLNIPNTPSKRSAIGSPMDESKVSDKLKRSLVSRL